MDMQDRGIKSFLNKKRVSYIQAVDEYYRVVGKDKPKAYRQQIREISANWTRFANAVDKGILHGKIDGIRVKLNTSFDEERKPKENK